MDFEHRNRIYHGGIDVQNFFLTGWGAIRKNQAETWPCLDFFLSDVNVFTTKMANIYFIE